MKKTRETTVLFSGDLVTRIRKFAIAERRTFANAARVLLSRMLDIVESSPVPGDRGASVQASSVRENPESAKVENPGHDAA